MATITTAFGLQAREAALEVPELLEADVGAEAALGDVVVGQPRAELVGDDRALADGDVGERAGVHEDRLALDGLQQVRIDGLDHPGGHGAVHFEVGGGDLPAAACRRPPRSCPCARAGPSGPLATARMAMTSLETEIWKPDSISKPSILPPLPMVMLRRAWAQKSMAHLHLDARRDRCRAAAGRSWPAARRRSCARAASARSGPPWPGCGRW